jgi:hypothetical protein
MFGSLFGSKWFGGSDAPPPAQPAPVAAAPKARPAAQPKTAIAHNSPGAIRPSQPVPPPAQVADKPAPQPAPVATASAGGWPVKDAGAAPAAAPAPGMISGAAPVVSGSSFDSRWGAVR